jgi:hypothetical protein
MPSSGSTPTATIMRWRSPIRLASRSRRCGSAMTAPGSRTCWPLSRRWCPGPRVAVCIEGTRGYGIGLARALAAAGLLVIECEQPGRKRRRGRGKSDPIDAHLAVLAALRLDTGRLPVPARRRRPGGTADLAGRPPGDHRGRHRAGQPPARPAASRGTIPTAGPPARRSATRPWLPWPGANCLLRPAASRLSAKPRSPFSRSRWPRPGGSSRTTAASCRPSSRTSLPV